MITDQFNAYMFITELLAVNCVERRRPMVTDITQLDAAQRIVRHMERLFPEVYGGLYDSFLRIYYGLRPIQVD